MGIVRQFIGATLSLISDSIEAVGSGEYREDLHLRIRTAAERGAELALENARLQDDIDRLRFNGPTMYKDEKLAMETVMDLVGDMLNNDEYASVTAFLKRCDVLPVNRAELEEISDDDIPF